MESTRKSTHSEKAYDPLLFSEAVKQFIKSFHYNYYQVLEFSYTSDPEFLGTMVYIGKGKFLQQAIQFCHNWKNWPQWNATLHRLTDSTSGQLYLFKVNWMGGLPYNANIYCRFPDDILINAIAKSLPHETSEKLSYIVSHANIIASQPVSIIGIKTGNEYGLPLSIYYDVSKLSTNDVKDTMAQLSCPLSITPDSLNRLESVIKKGVGSFSPEFIGIDVLSNGLKLEFPKIGVKDFSRILEFLEVPYGRRKTLGTIAQKADCTQLSYFTIKTDSSGRLSWKAYFVVRPIVLY